MTLICIWNPDWKSQPLDRMAALALKIVPRIAVDSAKGMLWADGKSLDTGEICRDLEAALREGEKSRLRIGVSLVPVVAEVAARFRTAELRNCDFTAENAENTESLGGTTELRNGTTELRTTELRTTELRTTELRTRDDASSIVTRVPAGAEREFLSRHPVHVLDPSPPLVNLFDGTGIESCGDLARLEQESVEVRFGAEGVHLWRLARADDNRLVFQAMPRNLPQSSMDWVDYALTDPERLVFVINALVDNISTALESQGLCAREMTLVFSLANRTAYEHLVRPSRSTASRKAWMRLIRTHLDRIELADAVTGILLRVESVTGEVERQGDIFDRGFATARATEETVAQLLDDQGAVIVVASNSKHPLIEKRTTWKAQEPAHAARAHMVKESRADPQLTLQLVAEPRRIVVKTARRRDHDVPVKYLDGAEWVLLDSAAGPDRVSGEQWVKPFAREYFRCVAESGTLVWIYREKAEWYIQGWWD